MLLVDGGTQLEVVVAEGPRADVLMGRRQSVTESIAGLVIRSGEPVVLQGAMARLSTFASGSGCSIVVPMTVSGRLVGIMNVNCRAAKRLEPAISDLLMLLAGQAGIFLETARLNQELEQKEKRVELLLDKFLSPRVQRFAELALVLVTGFAISGTIGSVAAYAAVQRELAGAERESAGELAIHYAPIRYENATRALAVRAEAFPWPAKQAASSAGFEPLP